MAWVWKKRIPTLATFTSAPSLRHHYSIWSQNITNYQKRTKTYRSWYCPSLAMAGVAYRSGLGPLAVSNSTLVHQSPTKTTLGEWLRAPHQHWKWYKDVTADVVHFCNENDKWLSYVSISQSFSRRRRTRQAKTWYNHDNATPTTPNKMMLVPMTINGDTWFSHYFYQEPCTTGIPSTMPQSPQNHIWDLPLTDHALADTHEFYQLIVGPDPPIDFHTGFNIATVWELETLVTCSDVSGRRGWIISTTDKVILAQGWSPQ